MINRQTHCLGDGYIRRGGCTPGSLHEAELWEDLNCLRNILLLRWNLKVSSSREEKRRSDEKSLQRSTDWDLKVAIKVGQNFKYDKSRFASAVRSSCAGFCAVKFIVVPLRTSWGTVGTEMLGLPALVLLNDMLLDSQGAEEISQHFLQQLCLKTRQEEQSKC